MEAMSKNQYMIMARVIGVYFFPFALGKSHDVNIYKGEQNFPIELIFYCKCCYSNKFEWHVGIGTLMGWH